MGWCLVKAQGQLYLYLFIPLHGYDSQVVYPFQVSDYSYIHNSHIRMRAYVRPTLPPLSVHHNNTLLL